MPLASRCKTGVVGALFSIDPRGRRESPSSRWVTPRRANIRIVRRIIRCGLSLVSVNERKGKLKLGHGARNPSFAVSPKCTDPLDHGYSPGWSTIRGSRGVAFDTGRRSPGGPRPRSHRVGKKKPRLPDVDAGPVAEIEVAREVGVGSTQGGGDGFRTLRRRNQVNVAGHQAVSPQAQMGAVGVVAQEVEIEARSWGSKRPIGKRPQVGNLDYNGFATSTSQPYVEYTVE